MTRIEPRGFFHRGPAKRSEEPTLAFHKAALRSASVLFVKNRDLRSEIGERLSEALTLEHVDFQRLFEIKEMKERVIKLDRKVNPLDEK